jgi:hypothetical protein
VWRSSLAIEKDHCMPREHFFDPSKVGSEGEFLLFPKEAALALLISHPFAWNARGWGTADLQ